MLTATFKFVIAMVAHAINDWMARRVHPALAGVEVGLVETLLDHGAAVDGPAARYVDAPLDRAGLR
jgi:hypothetical protein